MTQDWQNTDDGKLPGTAFYFFIFFANSSFTFKLLTCVQISTPLHPPSPKSHCVFLQNMLYTTQLWLRQLSSYIKRSKVWMYLFATQLFWDSLLAGNPLVRTSSSRTAFLSQSKFNDDHQGFALRSVMFSMHRNQRHCTFLFLFFLGYVFFLS